MFINFSKAKFTNALRVCCRCGAFQWRPVFLFCEACTARLKNSELPLCRTVSDQKFPVYAYFIWNQSTDSFLRPLVYSFKDGKCREAVSRIAEAFSWSLSPALDREFIFIPPPSRSTANDHASVWAEELAKIWGGKVWRPLEFAVEREAENSVSQKLKSRSERSRRRFSRVKIAKACAKAKLIFVDDIITTGSTARAAFKALGEPKHFEVWAIAWRPKLAGFDAF